MQKKFKITSIFILFISTLLFFLVGYYIYFSFQHKVNTFPVDYSDVIKNSKKLESLYSKLNTIEVSVRFTESKKNEEKYNEIRGMIDEVKKDIDKYNSYENMSTKQKVLSFFSVKNISLLLFEFAILLWIFFIFIGIKKEMSLNRKKKFTNEVIFDARHDIDKFEQSYNKIVEEDHKKGNSSADNSNRKSGYSTDHNFEGNINSNYSASGASAYKQNSSNTTKVDTVSSLKSSLDSLNEIVVQHEVKKNSIPNEIVPDSELYLARNEISTYTSKNELEYQEFQDIQSSEYLQSIKEKRVMEKLKNSMKNPKVNLIIDYYRSGMDSQGISEATNLSREEVDFVLRMLHKFMES